jgi:hypothetical protein
MNWLLQYKLWILAALTVALLLVVLPALAPWVKRLLGRPSEPASPSRANSKSNVLPFPETNAQAASPVDSSLQPVAPVAEETSVEPVYQERPTPFAIVAEVCGLQPPARESAEQSYRGSRVRWKLRLAGISGQEESGAVHAVKMYPDARSALGCGVYFGVNLDEHPELKAAQKDEIFLVEGTIENVSGMDIDLSEIRTVQKAAA